MFKTNSTHAILALILAILGIHPMGLTGEKMSEGIKAEASCS
jgi:hypothetical protein